MSEPITLKLEDGPTISIDPDRVTVGRVKKIYRALNEVKDAHNPFKRVPPIKVPEKDEAGNDTGNMREETYNEWKVRVLLTTSNELAKKEDEDEETYAKRQLAVYMEDHATQITFEFFNRLMEVFGEKVLTEDEFDTAPLDKARAFCLRVLEEGDITDPDGVFFPRKRTSTEA